MVTNILPILDTKSLALASRVSRQFRALAENIPSRFTWEQTLQVAAIKGDGSLPTRLDAHVRHVKMVGVGRISAEKAVLILRKYLNCVGLDLGESAGLTVDAIQWLASELRGRKMEKLVLSINLFGSIDSVLVHRGFHALFSNMDWSALKILDFRNNFFDYIGQPQVELLLQKLPEAQALEEFYVPDRNNHNIELWEKLPPTVRNICTSLLAYGNGNPIPLALNEALENRLRRYPAIDQISITLTLPPAEHIPGLEIWYQTMANAFLSHIHQFTVMKIHLRCRLDASILEAFTQRLATSPKLEEFTLYAYYDCPSIVPVLEALKGVRFLKRVKTRNDLQCYISPGYEQEIVQALLALPPHVEISMESGQNQQVYDRSALLHIR
jgi:hypothetical protein